MIEGVCLSADFRHISTAVKTTTLAEKLGTTPHISPLLQKAKRLGLDAEGLEHLAIQRGCTYYHDGGPLPANAVDESLFSNEQLALALLNPALRYDPQTLRLGAAMLSTEGNDPKRIAWVAKLERSEVMVRYVAEAGRRFEPQNPFWQSLLTLLPETLPPKSSAVPHPTRFVAMTGITRRGVETVVQWIRPRRPVLANG
jgi:hypothetical protein